MSELIHIGGDSPTELAETRCIVHELRLVLPPGLAALDGLHPCFSSTAAGHQRAARLHLPVSPACNIECRFCARKFNAHEQRPGVARGLIRPEDTPDIVARALQLVPSLKVIGIAGPGETLATNHALRAFAAVHQRFPHLLLCLSTNGLMLKDRAEELAANGVGTITVTVNAVDAGIAAAIVGSISLHGKRVHGIVAGALLAERQLAGISRACSLGLVVKINTVLIPGLNDGHIAAIAAATASFGALRINIIPLLPQHELAHYAEPNAAQLAEARKSAARHLDVFTHCHRCRADAFGVPGGEDFSGQLYGASPVEATFSHG
jgi:nitrogen fixation protein NifB